MQNWNNYSTKIQRELTSAGYRVVKNDQEKQWEVVDRTKVLLYNRSLGDLMSKAAKEFGIN